MVDNTPPPHEQDVIADDFVDAVPSLGDSNMLEVLSDRRRRYVLYYLTTVSNGVAELDELATQLRRWERAADDEVPDDHHARIVASLHHVDLPKFAEAGVLEFDPRSDVVRYRGDDDHEAILELVVAMADG